MAGRTKSPSSVKSGISHTPQSPEATPSGASMLNVNDGNLQIVRVLNNLGTILHDRGQIDEAAAAYRRAIEIAPGFAEAHGNLGNALKATGAAEDAVAAWRRARS